MRLSARCNMRSGARAWRGFTLIELLVVVAIIVVLIAIILPSLGQAKEQSRTVACGANLRQIGIAAVAYTVENGGHVLPGGYRSYTNSSNGTMHYETWGTILVYGGLVPRTPVTRQADPPGTRSVFYCPSGLADVRPTSNNSSQPAPLTERDPNGSRPNRQQSQIFDNTIWVDSWYGINSVTGEGATPVYPCHRLPDDADANRFINFKLSALNNPGQLVFIFDGFSQNIAGHSARISARHMNQTKTNVVFMDGHVETIMRNRMPPAADLTTDYANWGIANLKRYWPYPHWRIDQ